MNLDCYKKCPGCGVKLQNTNKNLPGFFILPKIQKGNIICKRCFELKNYGKTSFDDIQSLIKTQENIDLSNKNTLLIVDVFDIVNGLDIDINKSKEDIFVLINKIDKLPKDINYNITINNLLEMVYMLGFSKEKVFICSSKIKNSMIKLNEFLSNSNKRTWYLIGYSNVGKSSIINQLKLINGQKPNLVVSKKINTTIQPIETKFKKYTIYDCPGFLIENKLDVYFNNFKHDFKSNKFFIKNFQLSKSKSFIINGLIKVDVELDSKITKPSTITFLCSCDYKIDSTSFNHSNAWNNNISHYKLGEDFNKLKLNEFDFIINNNRTNISINPLCLMVIHKGIKSIHITGFECFVPTKYPTTII